MKFSGQRIQKLEHEQDRQTVRQTRPNALPAALAGGNELLHFTKKSTPVVRGQCATSFYLYLL